MNKSRNPWPEVLCKYELLNFKVLKIERNNTSDYIECLIFHLEPLKRIGEIRSQILQNLMVISIRYSNLAQNGNFLSFSLCKLLTKLANASIRESSHITVALEGMLPGKAVSFHPFLTVITISRLFRETGLHSQLDGQP